ncbi:unnamed protein product [Paramecium sonneborni]|uniref:Uncharacterized protein n=1 Tax=Paramecium sonneborni TaxID=65129 RepID=A0A8S1R8V2_9CILI|nr:unnamed protein product [Paramecium sonneborni]
MIQEIYVDNIIQKTREINNEIEDICQQNNKIDQDQGEIEQKQISEITGLLTNVIDAISIIYNRLSNDNRMNKDGIKIMLFLNSTNKIFQKLKCFIAQLENRLEYLNLQLMVFKIEKLNLQNEINIRYEKYDESLTNYQKLFQNQLRFYVDHETIVETLQNQIVKLNNEQDVLRNKVFEYSQLIIELQIIQNDTNNQANEKQDDSMKKLKAAFLQENYDLENFIATNRMSYDKICSLICWAYQEYSQLKQTFQDEIKTLQHILRNQEQHIIKRKSLIMNKLLHYNNAQKKTQNYYKNNLQEIMKFKIQITNYINSQQKIKINYIKLYFNINYKFWKMNLSKFKKFNNIKSKLTVQIVQEMKQQKIQSKLYKILNNIHLKTKKIKLFNQMKLRIKIFSKF